MKFPWTQSIVDVLKDEGKVDEKLQHVAKSLVKKGGDISVVVEELGPALTHKDVEIRLKGTKFLSDLLKSLPYEFLTTDQLKFITQFYIDRMKDQHSITPQVISGLLAIVQMKNFPSTEAVHILSQLFTQIPCQSQVRNDRANIFSIIQVLSENHHVELEAYGSDFIYGVIQAVEGERDPRNLQFLFDFLPRFIKSYPLKHFSEEMFEVFSCYFPIDFYPSPNDPKAITRDVLAEKLKICLCASKDFAQFCYPLALEKLDSDLTVAKLDSLELLSYAASIFEAKSTLEHFEDIWQALKNELLPGSNNKEIRAKALEAIVSIIKAVEHDKANLELILSQIFTITIGTLLNRDSNLFKPTLELVIKCAEACDHSCMYVANKFLPITITELTTNEEITDIEKREVLEDFLKILQIITDKNILKDYANDNYMLNIQKQLMKIFISPCDSELLQSTWKVITKLVPILSDENRIIIYSKLKVELLKPSPQEDECLLELAKVYPNEVHKLVLEDFLLKNYDDSVLAKNIFTTLSPMLSVAELREHIIEVICVNLFNNKSSLIQLVVLEVLREILTKSKSPEIAMILHTEWRLIIKLIDLIKNSDVENAQKVMYEASIVMSLVMRTLPVEKQMEIIDNYLPSMKLQSSVSDLYVTSGILGFLDASVPLQGHFEQLIDELTKLSLTTKDDETRKIANQLICSLFNRAPIDDKHRKILDKILDLIKDEIKKHNHHAVIMLGWIAKGLLASGHPDASTILETLSELLDHPKLSKAAELAFEIISLEYPELHLPLLKHLFKQKIFVLAMKFFEGKLEKFSDHHLTALAHILQITPHVVLKMNIDKIGPILFKCIESGADEKDPHPKRVLLSLKIFNNFIHDKHKFILTHLQRLVKEFLKLSQFKQSMEVRIVACKCLESLTKFPLFSLVPFKNDVTHELANALDDPKRLVRNAAVDARMAWFLLGENEKSE
ncbi:hypothetical protein PVAND_002792 [Polypedilum vanderplanki]|uniref:MMS19 nucleotide excision repair protein n=1 Tax=Polypedilum vanderplanki TaxID=319348 RepID=A0A9J6BSF9_POLVA|nr:hypothetical protein PVAND_002792 [Polypedilum vanderplanki]